MRQEITQIITTIIGLQEDNTVPKSTKAKLEKVVRMLKENTEEAITVNKALHELGEIADDINLESYTRTQIWNIVSMLESV
jgi:uncharacterized protein (UPF0147 family)